MVTLREDELLSVVGGINITGTLINSLIKGISTFLDLGRALGSAIRRVVSGGMCPL